MKPAVDQLWDTVKGILSFGTNLMWPFLRLFRSEIVNGLSPFAVNIETPGNVKIHQSAGLTIKYSHHFCDS